ncbi:uncharacterized protein [Dermacentor albipictus]|uniref:uncharacterized protein isoform X2 n=1 Tax=Dermacentor albipictus TaxID=60249 RepID=UPI0038FCF626
MLCTGGAVFASWGNVKFRVLAKILEATILCEQAGLHVDYICSDGTAWNCLMWSAIGLRDNFKDVQCKVIHPPDTSRSGSAKEATLDHMLEFLDSWEDHSKGLGFLSKHISARSLKGGNMSDGVLESLLSIEQLLPESGEQTEAADNTNVLSAAVEISVAHISYNTEKSDSHLVDYTAVGYVARKRIL